MGGFAAARGAMMNIQAEYKAAAECDEKDFTHDINLEDLLDEEDQDDEEPHYAFLTEED